MRRVFKVILLTFLCTIGGLALVLGGVYLFGGMDEKPVYATNLTFSETEVVKSGPFSLTVNTTTENVNKKTLVLETSKTPNGDAIINYPKYITIGEPFHIAPILIDNVPQGGYFELYARYEGEATNQSVIAKCKILIDVPIQSVELNIDQVTLKPGNSINISKANETKISDIVSLSPANAIMPYNNSSSAISGIENGSLFAGKDVKNKKIFLQIQSLGETNPATFRVGEGANATYSTVAELTYKYVNGSIVATNTISVVTSGNDEVGNIVICAYVCPSYDNNPDNIEDLDEENVATVKHDVSVVEYTIDQMNISNDTSSLYLGETTKIYLNNSHAEEGSFNLGLDVVSSDGKSISLSTLPKEMLNKYIYINFADNSVGGILSRVDGTQNGGLYGLNCSSNSTEMGEWYFNITVNNFQKYLDYNNNGNKIKLVVTFYDNGLNESQDVIQKEVYLIPKITEVDKVESSQYSISAKSGSKLNFDTNNYSIVFVDNKTPVGIANNFKIVHYVKLNEPTNGEIVLNGVTLESEYEHMVLNGESILILKTPNAQVTGSGSFKIYSQACYDDGQSKYFLGNSCNTDIEVVEAIEYIDCYSYEGDKAVNFSTFEFNENDKDGTNSIVRYLYVTTAKEQLPKLATFVSNNKLKVQVKQVSGLTNEDDYNSSTLGGGLQDQNKNTITFGNWEEVRDGGSVVGYKISYTIGEVVTIQIGDNKIQNLFDIKVYLDIEPLEVTTNYKIATGNVSSLQYLVKDKILQTTILSLDSYGAEDNPVVLSANVDDSGNLQWNGANLSNLTYGFAYEGNSPVSSSGYSYRFAFNGAELPSNICSFTAQENFKGGINFASVPYRESGYTGKFTFLCQSPNSDNSIMKWSSTNRRFEKVVNPSLQEKTLYFKLIGLNIIIEANSTNISGVNGTRSHIFKQSNDDTNYLFTLKKVEGTTKTDILTADYTKFLSMETVFGNPEDNSKTIYSLQENKFEITTDFIAGGSVAFAFNCRNAIIAILDGDKTLSNITKQITGAFEVEQKVSSESTKLGESEENALSAPMFDGLTKDNYLTVKYGALEVSEDNNPFANGYTLSFVRITGTDSSATAEWLMIAEDGSIKLKAINQTGVVSTKFIVRISKGGAYSDFVVTIYARSSISISNLVIRKGEGNENEIKAGKDNGISFGSGISFAEESSLANLATNNKISAVNITAVYNQDGIQNFVKSTNWNGVSPLTFGLYSGDLASEQTVNIQFVFVFTDSAGEYTITKQIKVTPNISLTLKTNKKSESNPSGYDGYDFISGNTITVFSAESYDYTQNGSVILPSGSDVSLDDILGGYTDTITNHPHIKDINGLFVPETGEVVLVSRYKTDSDEEEEIINASYVLVYDYENDGLEYSQEIRFDFKIKLYAI
ncbi:MAG: hypothetical protein ACI4L7_01165 [Christensenellales bacterium]